MQFPAMEHLVVLCVLVWECSPIYCVCVCVSVRDEAQRGVKTWDGASLVVLPELFSTWGSLRLHTSSGFHRRLQSRVHWFLRVRADFCCFYTAANAQILQLCCFYRPPVYQKDVQPQIIRRNLSGEIDWKLILPHSLILSSVSVNLTEGTNK